MSKIMLGGDGREIKRSFFKDRVGDLKTLERRKEEKGLEMEEIIKRDRQEQREKK